MEIVRVDLGERSYEVMVGYRLMSELSELISNLSLGSSCALVTHATIFDLFGERIVASLKQRRIRAIPVFVPDGEASKSLEWAGRLYQVMLDSGLDRDSFVVALGGGVIGDLAGFVAATYMRGIGVIQVPTSLLAQVDASIGGKTAVNLTSGKNLVGVFHQPRLVIADVEALEHLSDKEFKSGMAEVIKYGVIKDAELFEFLEKNHKKILARDVRALEWVIHRSCLVKGWVVSQDEKEGGLRAILNYGHTVGHALETAAQYALRHGEAIAIGMACAGWISYKMGFWSESDAKRQSDLLRKYDLPAQYKRLSASAVYPYLWSDKKKKAGSLTFILPKKFGEVFICRNVPDFLIKETLKKFHK